MKQQETESIKFSVVVPIYNVEEYLNRCIKSVVNQTYSNIEIILVDDGAKDRCPEMCDEWQKNDKRIKVIHKKNAGLGEARNSGLEVVTGDYVCFFDSDDFIKITLLEDAYKIIIKESPDLIDFGHYGVKVTGSIRDTFIPDVPKTKYTGAEVMEKFLPDFICTDPKTGKATNLIMSACCAIYKTKKLKDIEFAFVSERELISEDVYSIMRLIPQINSVCILEDAYYYYCENSNSLTHTYQPERFERILHYQECLEKLCSDSCYNDEVRYRINRPFLDNLLACVKLEVQGAKNNGIKKTYKRIKGITSNAMVQKALHIIPNTSYSKSRQVLNNCMKKGNTWGVIVLVWLKETGQYREWGIIRFFR